MPAPTLARGLPVRYDDKRAVRSAGCPQQIGAERCSFAWFARQHGCCSSLPRSVAMNKPGAPPRFRWMLLTAVLGVVVSVPPSVRAQQIQIRSAPNDNYWTCFGPFLDGD